MKIPMQRLTVSDEVFFRLRALDQSGAQSEDQILRRLLDCAPKQFAEAATGSHPNSPNREADAFEGFEDATYGIVFPEGFKIFRTYKGRPYTAHVVRGRWRLEDSGAHTPAYDSLNRLSQAVIDGNENAWMFWYFKTPDGTPKRIAELRDPALVQKRPRRKRRRGWVAWPQAVPVPEPAATSQVAVKTEPSRKPPAPPLSTPAKPGGGKAWEPAAKKR